MTNAKKADEILTAAALAEPEPADEPVGAQCKFDSEKSWGNCTIEHHYMVQKAKHEWPDYQTRLVYARPQLRKPPTDAQIEELHWGEMSNRDLSFARAVLALVGIGSKP